MSVTTHKSSWLKQNYEKLLLVLVLLLLLCSAVFLVLQVKIKTDEQATVLPPVQFAKGQLVDQVKLDQRLEILDRTNLMDVTRGVVGDELRVACVDQKCNKPIPYDAVICPFCKAKQPEVVNPQTVSTLGDGISDVWKKQYGFDVLDQTVTLADPDSDGFNNLEEFRAKTNPLDPKSHPDFASALRIWDLKARPFKLRFMTAMKMGTNETFQINLANRPRSMMVKIGDTVEGYKIVAHEPAAADGDVLVLENGSEKLRLPKNKALQGRPDFSADLILLLDRSRYKNLSRGDSIKIRDALYKIIDITTNAVTIRGPQSGNDVTVPLISDAERNEVVKEVAAEMAEAVPAASGTAVVPRNPAVRTEGQPVQRMEGVPVRPRGELPVRPRGETPVVPPGRARGRS